MFNVTVLKMKDIIKYFMGIVITLFLVIFISKYFNKSTDEQKIVQEVKSGVRTLSENSMIECIDETIPSIETVNQEYKNIANEDDNHEEGEFLQEVLKTQISSIRGVEEIEKKKQEEQVEVANQDSNDQDAKEEIQLARNRAKNTDNYKQSN